MNSNDRITLLKGVIKGYEAELANLENKVIPIMARIETVKINIDKVETEIQSLEQGQLVFDGTN